MAFCSWCRKTPDKLHVTNADNSAGICSDCCDQLLGEIAHTNRKQALPHLYEGEERRTRPMPRPFKEG